MDIMCTDNRFEIIGKAKKHLLEATNIDTSPDEMKVLDNFLFRCWQMGWLDRYAEQTEPSVFGNITSKCLNCKNNGSYKCLKCDGEMYYKQTESSTEAIQKSPQTECISKRDLTDCSWKQADTVGDGIR